MKRILDFSVKSVVVACLQYMKIICNVGAKSYFIVVHSQQ